MHSRLRGGEGTSLDSAISNTIHDSARNRTSITPAERGPTYFRSRHTRHSSAGCLYRLDRSHTAHHPRTWTSKRKGRDSSSTRAAEDGYGAVEMYMTTLKHYTDSLLNYNCNFVVNKSLLFFSCRSDGGEAFN